MRSARDRLWPLSRVAAPCLLLLLVAASVVPGLHAKATIHLTDGSSFALHAPYYLAGNSSFSVTAPIVFPSDVNGCSLTPEEARGKIVVIEMYDCYEPDRIQACERVDCAGIILQEDFSSEYPSPFMVLPPEFVEAGQAIDRVPFVAVLKREWLRVQELERLGHVANVTIDSTSPNPYFDVLGGLRYTIYFRGICTALAIVVTITASERLIGWLRFHKCALRRIPKFVAATLVLSILISVSQVIYYALGPFFERDGLPHHLQHHFVTLSFALHLPTNLASSLVFADATNSMSRSREKTFMQKNSTLLFLGTFCILLIDRMLNNLIAYRILPMGLTTQLACGVFSLEYLLASVYFVYSSNRVLRELHKGDSISGRKSESASSQKDKLQRMTIWVRILSATMFFTCISMGMLAAFATTTWYVPLGGCLVYSGIHLSCLAQVILVPAPSAHKAGAFSKTPGLSSPVSR